MSLFSSNEIANFNVREQEVNKFALVRGLFVLSLREAFGDACWTDSNKQFAFFLSRYMNINYTTYKITQ